VKTLPIAIEDHYATGSTTLADAIEIIRTDGQEFRFTSAVQDSVIDGDVYSASQGFAVSSVVVSAGLSVDNMELDTIDDGTLFDVLDIKAGIWSNAKFRIFRYNWSAPEDGIDPLIAGTFGEITLPLGAIKIELRGLQQRLQQEVGNASSKTCRARFCDFPSPAGNNLCRLDVAGFTYAGTVTSVVDAGEFSASALAQTGSEFTEGIVVWVTGDNAGLFAKVRVYTGATKTFDLVLPMARPVQVGDTFNAVIGCSKRRDEDCMTRFDNAVNFQGEPDRPGVDALTSSPIPDA
jgi:uncharacterized phage protein (TIGR02218 family)